MPGAAGRAGGAFIGDGGATLGAGELHPAEDSRAASPPQLDCAAPPVRVDNRIMETHFERGPRQTFEALADLAERLKQNLGDHQAIQVWWRGIPSGNHNVNMRQDGQCIVLEGASDILPLAFARVVHYSQLDLSFTVRPGAEREPSAHRIHTLVGIRAGRAPLRAREGCGTFDGSGAVATARRTLSADGALPSGTRTFSTGDRPLPSALHRRRRGHSACRRPSSTPAEVPAAGASGPRHVRRAEGGHRRARRAGARGGGRPGTDPGRGPLRGDRRRAGHQVPPRWCAGSRTSAASWSTSSS